MPRCVQGNGSRLVLTGVLIILGLAVGSANMPRAEAAGLLSPDMSIAIDLNGDTVPECSTQQSPPADTCTVTAGQQFTISGDLNTLAGLADFDQDTKNGYNSIDLGLRYSSGLTIQDRPEEAEVVGPQCGVTADFHAAGAYAAACVVGIGANEMTFLGRIYEVDFRCPSTPGLQTVRMVHGGGAGSQLSTDGGVTVLDQNHKGIDEVLTIDCSPESPDLSIDIDTNADTVPDCTTDQAPPAGTCSVVAGRTFTVRARLNSIAGLLDVDGDTQAGYPGVDLRLLNSAGIALQNRPANGEWGPAGAPFWPDCAIRAEFVESPTAYVTGCTTSGAESVHQGLLAEADHSCLSGPSVQTITLVHGASPNSHLVDEAFGFAIDVNDGAVNEVLTINCLPASPDLSIEVGASGGTAARCSTQAVPPVDTCHVGLGEPFTVRLRLNSIAGLPDSDGDTVRGYLGIQASLGRSAGLTFNHRPGFEEWGPPGAPYWPDCSIRVDKVHPMSYLSACAVNGLLESTFSGGVVMEADYACAASASTESVAMSHSTTFGSNLGSDAFLAVLDLNDGGVDEVLTIECAFVWDVNEDGYVSGGDIAAVVMAFGQAPPADPNTDVNADGSVSGGDIAADVLHFGESAP